MSAFGKAQVNPDGSGNTIFEPHEEPHDVGFTVDNSLYPPPQGDEGSSSKGSTPPTDDRDGDANNVSTAVRRKERKRGKRPNATVTLGPFTTSQINTKTNEDYHPVMRILIALDWSDGTLRGLLSDFLAGITLALSQVAPSVAFSIIAHMNPINGLYASFVQGFVMAFLGGRPGMLSGPPGSMVVLYPELVDKHGPEALYAACILTGIFMWLPGILCIAKYVRVLPLPVMIGFVNGLGVILAKNQIDSFKDETGGYVTGTRAAYSAMLCIVSFAVVVFLPRVTQMVPSPFVALIVGAAIEHIFGLGTVTVKDLYVLSGDFPIPKIPDLNYSNLSGDLVTDVVVVAILSFIVGSVESLMMVHLLNNLTGTRGNFEVESLAVGAANILTGLFQGFAGCGLVGPSILNFTSGGGFRRLSALIYSIGMILIVVVASPAIDLVPMPVLAAVVFYVSYKTFDWNTFEMILLRRIPLMDSLVICVVVVVTVEEDLAVAVACGFGLSLLTFFYDMAFGAHCIGICRFKKSKKDSCCKKCMWCLYSGADGVKDDDEEEEMVSNNKNANNTKRITGEAISPTASSSTASLSSSDEELFERDREEIHRTGLGRVFVSYSALTANPHQPLPQTLGDLHDGVLSSESDEDHQNDIGSTPGSITLHNTPAFQHLKHKEIWAAARAFVESRHAKVAALRGGVAESSSRVNEEVASTGDGGGVEGVGGGIHNSEDPTSSLIHTTRLTVQSKVGGADPNHLGQTRSFHHHAINHRHLLHHSHPRSGLLSVEIVEAPSEVPGIVVLKLHCSGVLFFGSALAFQQCCEQVLEDLVFAAYRRDVLTRKRLRHEAKMKRSRKNEEPSSTPAVAHPPPSLTQEDLLGRVTDIVFDCGFGRMTLHDSSAVDTIQEIASSIARKVHAVVDVPIHRDGESKYDGDESTVAGVVSIRVPIRSHLHNLDRQSELLVKRSRPLFMGSVMHDNLRKRLERSTAANVCFVAAHNVAPIAATTVSSSNSNDDMEDAVVGRREEGAVDDGTTAGNTMDETEGGGVGILVPSPSPTTHDDQRFIVIGFDVYSSSLRVVVAVFATIHQWQHDPKYAALIHAGMDVEVEEVAAMYFGDNGARRHPPHRHVRPSSLVGGHHRLALYDYQEEKALPWYKRILTHKTVVRIPEAWEITHSNPPEEIPEGVARHVRPLPLHYKVIHSSAHVVKGLGKLLEVAEYQRVEEDTSKNTQDEEGATPSSANEPVPDEREGDDKAHHIAGGSGSAAAVIEAFHIRNAIKTTLFTAQADLTLPPYPAAVEPTDAGGFSILHKRLEVHPIPKRTFLGWLKRVFNPLIDGGDIDK